MVYCGLMWKRPTDNVNYPNVWLKFAERESKKSENRVNYRIQDLSEEYFDRAIDHMIKFFICDEPISRSIDGVNDKNYVADLEKLWRNLFTQHMSLICVREDTNEIIAMNVNYVSTKGDTFFDELVTEFKSGEMLKVFKVIDCLHEVSSPYEKYNDTKYMSSVGLAVDTKYRGLALGQRMLEARKLMAAPFGLKFTQTVFTSDFSNQNADKAGFILDAEFTFDELNRMNPEFQFKNVPSSRVSLKTFVF